MLFMPATLHGHWRLFWGDPSGRFFPLCGREFFVLRELGLLSAPLFYGVQSAKFLIGAFFTGDILKRAGAGARLRFLALLFVFGSPAFMVSVSRLFVAELTPFVLILACLWLLGSERAPGGWRLALGVFLAGAAMFHKETVFLAVGCMGATLALWPGRTRARVKAGLLLLAASGAFGAAYLAFGYAYMEGGGYTAFRLLGTGATAWYFARNDLPLLAMLLLGVWHCTLAWRERSPAAFEAACLAGGLAFTAEYLLLRIVSPWYLLPAYAFVLPALPGAVNRLVRMAGRPAQTAAFRVALAVGLAWSLAGYSFLDFNKSAARGTQQVLDFLKTNAPPKGSQPVSLHLPRLYRNAEPVLNLAVYASHAGLDKAYNVRPEGTEDIWKALKGRTDLTVLTPYTRVSQAEQSLLGACQETLFASAAPAALPLALARFFRLESPVGIQRSDPTPLGAWRIFRAGMWDSPAGGLQAESAPLPCPQGFEWEGFAFSIAVTGVKVCPMTGGTLPVRLTNTTRRDFVRDEAVPGGELGLVLFTAKPGEAFRSIGFHRLPERVGAGESIELELPFTVFTYQPGIIGVTIGSNSTQEVHPVLPMVSIVSNYLPRFGVCWQ